MASSLSIDVFKSGYKPIPGGPGWDGSTPATWPASTSTLISGGRGAVLVDALLTTGEGERLAAWVHNTGRRPHAIFVTHGHGDHFFGAGPVLDAFPGAQLMACDQQVVDEARGQTTPEVMAIWNTWFAGQFSPSPVVSALASSQESDLEGHPLLFRTIGGADGTSTTPSPHEASTRHPARRSHRGRAPASRGCCRGGSRALMMHGEPGAGNTALLEYLAGRPRQTGVIGQGVHGRHGTAPVRLWMPYRCRLTARSCRGAGMNTVRVAPARP